MKEGEIITVNKTRQIWVICPRCYKGRFINPAGRINALDFTGLCSECSSNIASDAYKPYRNTDKVRNLRNKLMERTSK